MSELVGLTPARSGPVGDKAVTRAGAGSSARASVAVQTAPDLDLSLHAERSPVQTAPETTLETVSGGNPASALVLSTISAPRLRQTSSAGRRLPRFARAKRSHRPPLALQPRDLELLRTAHEYRLISTPQYLTLFSFESRDGIYRRLQRLFHHGYLDRLGTNPNAPLVYALGRRGAEVLELPAPRQVGERYVAHQLMIGDLRLAMTLAARAGGLGLTWRTLRPDLPVRSDGALSLRFPSLPDGRNTAHFFIEADRSTMTRERFVDKLRAYAAWQDRGGHTEALGIRRFRVLIVTRSEERLRSLIAATTECGELGPVLPMYWFSSEPRYRDITLVLAKIWTTAADPEKAQSIVPAQA